LWGARYTMTVIITVSAPYYVVGADNKCVYNGHLNIIIIIKCTKSLRFSKLKLKYLLPTLK